MPDTTYRRVRIADKDGMVEEAEALPSESAPRWAADVVRKTAEWRTSEGDAPVFAGPVPFVVPPTDSDEPFFEYHHQPAVTWCDNGDLLAAWYTTRLEDRTTMTVLASRLRAGRDSWDPSAEFFKALRRNMTGTALFNDGRGTLYHFNGVSLEGVEEWENLALLLRTSADGGVTWSPPRTISTGAHFQKRHQVCPGLSEAPDGTIILPCDATPGAEGPSAIHVSRDGGRTWLDPGGDIRGIHAGVVALKDGRLLALGRAQELEGRMPRSVSRDFGVSWSHGPSPFPAIHSGQRLVLMRLREGPLLLVSFTGAFRDVPRDERRGMDFAGITGFGMFAAASFDEGETWPLRRLLTPGAGEFDGMGWTGKFEASPTEAEPGGYLAATQTPGGIIHLLTSGLHYRFNLAWLRLADDCRRD